MYTPAQRADEMFYSTDLLVRKDAKLFLIWRLAITKGNVGASKKRQILAVKIKSIVEELVKRIPVHPLTADQLVKCFSLRLISQLLHGTCIVHETQCSNLYVDAEHYAQPWKTRYSEREKSIKRRKKDDKSGEDPDWDQHPTGDHFMKKKRLRSEVDLSKTELHESQVDMGMDFLDRALFNNRSAHDLANITLPEDTTYWGRGGGADMHDNMFVGVDPVNDLVPITDDMMEMFLNGGEDTTFTTKEASENPSLESLRDRRSGGEGLMAKGHGAKDREERATSEMERHRASSVLSGRQTPSMHQQPQLIDDMMPMDDANLSYSMAGIEGDSRTSVPAHFVPTGPLAVSSQVNPAHEPILPSEPSQIVPHDSRDETLDVAAISDAMVSMRDDDRPLSEKGDGEDAQRASAGSEDSRRKDLMEDAMMADDMREGAKERMDREKRGGRSPTRIAETPKGRGREGDKERDEEEEEEIVPPKKKQLTLSSDFVKESIRDYSDTYLPIAARRAKLVDNRKKKASDLLKTVPSIMGRPILKNKILNDLMEMLKVDKIMLRADEDTVDEMLEEEDEDTLELMPWEEIEREKKREREQEEEDEEGDGESRPKKRRDEEPRPEEEGNQSGQREELLGDLTMNMADATMIGGMEDGVEHMSVATIEGDFEERNEYADRLMETRYEDREMTGEERRKMREEQREDDDEEFEQARRRRTTGHFSDGRMGDQTDLVEQFSMFNPQMDESRRSESGAEEREMMEETEHRAATEARMNREKRDTMATVDNHQARGIILRACNERESKRVTLAECLPLGANAATAARMFYNLLVLAKNQKVVPEQEIAYGDIAIGLCPPHQFKVPEEAC